MDKDIKLIYDKLKELNRNILCKTSTGTVTDACCPATNTLLGEIKTAIDNLDISVDNLVLNTDTLEINTDEVETLLTDIKVDLEKVIDTFQILDCEGLPIGTPQDILKTIVLNKLTTQICNVQELADAINAVTPITYNNVNHYLLDNTNPILTIPANTVHSISYKIIDATVDISINGTILPYIVGESDMEEATTLIANEYVFNATNGKIKIKTIN